ncbi:MAG TPA: ferritin family protein [Elusimicrobiales bacterium]|nr:ferritin family protein [Elusimicrobiales bacterium]
MFTKQDYLKYFSQIEKLERGMAASFKKCAEKVDDPELKKIFTQLSKEEAAHGKVADAMLEIFESKPD